MSWTYNQTTGQLTDPSGHVIATGYSGAGKGKNNPAMQNVHNVGPIPQGGWTIGPSYHNHHTGPVTMNLTPATGTNTFGRTHLLIHGDSRQHPGHASHGCIILDRMARQRVSASPDRDLLVVSGVVWAGPSKIAGSAAVA